MSPQNEFLYTVPAAKVGFEPLEAAFEADERACKALASRYDILSVEALKAHASLVRESDGVTIAVKGAFVADVCQSCVATLESVPEHIEEDFEAWFLDESQVASFKRAKARHKSEDPDELPFEDGEGDIADEHEDPESIVNGQVDLGELVAQYLSLSLNPYPHSPKALQDGPVGDEADLKGPNPFAALEALKDKE